MRRSREQLRYVMAKARYEVALKEFGRLVRPYEKRWERGELSGEEFIDKAMEIEREIGLDKIHGEYTKARRELVRWGERVLKERLSPQEWERIKMVFDPKNSWAWDRVAEALAKLDVESLENFTREVGR